MTKDGTGRDVDNLFLALWSKVSLTTAALRLTVGGGASSAIVVRLVVAGDGGIVLDLRCIVAIVITKEVVASFGNVLNAVVHV